MDLKTVEMSQPEARRAFLAYKAEFAKHHNEIDGALMRSYKELAAGRRVLYLPDTIKAGGVTPKGLPKLAITTADQQWARCEVSWDGRVVFGRPDRRSYSRMVELVKLPPDTVPRPSGKAPEGRAMVPIIPPQFRPPYNLGNYHILWEAEWQPVAPRDPALLKDLGGGMYAVLAVWDLTPLEMMVLGMARTTR